MSTVTYAILITVDAIIGLISGVVVFLFLFDLTGNMREASDRTERAKHITPGQVYVTDFPTTPFDEKQYAYTVVAVSGDYVQYRQTEYEDAPMESATRYEFLKYKKLKP